MVRAQDSESPTPEDVARHYASGYEANRLVSGTGRLDVERSRELLTRFLPPPPARILDVGGGPGGYSLWLRSAAMRFICSTSPRCTFRWRKKRPSVNRRLPWRVHAWAMPAH
jgi:hypothetical protein